MTEALAQAGFKRIVGRVGDARDQTSRGKLAGAFRFTEPASRMNAPLVHVVGGGSGPECIDVGISFDETRQFGSFRSHVPDLKQKVFAPMTSVRSSPNPARMAKVGSAPASSWLKVWRTCQPEAAGRCKDFKNERRGGRKRDLLRLQIRGRTDRRLQRPSLARVVRLVEDSVSAVTSHFALPVGSHATPTRGAKAFLKVGIRPAGTP